MRNTYFISCCLMLPMLMLLGCGTKQPDATAEADSQLTVSKERALRFVGLEERPVYEALALNARLICHNYTSIYCILRRTSLISRAL